MKHKRWMSLFFVPIVGFIFLIFYQDSEFKTNHRFIFPVSSFNLISNGKHPVLNYKIGYSPKNCEEQNPLETVYYCFSHKYFTLVHPSKIGCRYYIKGQCKGNKFIAGIEQLNIPETELQQYKKIIEQQFGYLQLEVGLKGKVTILDISGKKINPSKLHPFP